MLATDTGRISIIKSAIKSSTAVRIRYKPAKNCIKRYLSSDHRDTAQIFDKISDLQAEVDDVSKTTWAREDAKLSIAALESFLTMQNQIGGYDFIPIPTKGQGHLPISGVHVSVNVDLLVSRTYRRREQVGGAIFRFTQSDSETEAAINKRMDIGRFAATLTHLHVVQNLAGNREPHRPLSMAVDVQFGQAILCPNSYAQRVANIENACRFISAMWDDLKAEVL